MNEIELRQVKSQHLEGVKKNFPPEKKEGLAKAARDFESILTGMMLKSMTETTGGLFGEETEGSGADVYDQLFQTSIAQFISNTQGLGIAEQIYKKLTGEDLPPALMNSKGLPPRVKTVINEAISKVPKIQPAASSLQRLERYSEIIKEASATYGVSENIVRSIILVESAANEHARSKTDAKGLMQLMDATARELGVQNSWDPVQNIYGGTKYIATMLKEYDGNLELALAAYNAGPGNVNKYNGVPPFEETKSYIKRVLGYLNHFEVSNENQ